MSATTKDLIISVVPESTENMLFSARAYQTELMEQAKSENIIVCLPTGSGKTYIAVMLIKEMSSSIRVSWKDGGKRTVFLVKTVQLVEQQSNCIRVHTGLAVGCYYGDLGVDFWRKDKWMEELEAHQVLVFTAQVFLDLIDHNYLSLNRVNLIIFDECHHASGDDRYAALMKNHYDKCVDPPRVLGLTASISGRKIKPKDLRESARELEKIYRARIETGSDRSESVRYGTSVNVETIPCPSYREKILKGNESLLIPFEILRFMTNRLQSEILSKKAAYDEIESRLTRTMLTSKYRTENVAVYTAQSSEYTTFTQFRPVTLPLVKRHLDNLIEIGYELGLWGLFLFAKALRKRLKSNRLSLMIVDSNTRELFDDCLTRLDCLVDDILKNLYRLHDTDLDVLFSPKVHQLFERLLQQNTDGRCIVFVERIYAASILSQVLSDLNAAAIPAKDTRLKINYITGAKSNFTNSVMTVRYQRDIIKEFRSAEINVLIATAVVEEGLDIPQCDLVVRFNKPQNFSSYMQSKGRARAKQNSSYVLFMDESNADAYHRDQNEYEQYEEIEKIIQRGLSLDPSDSDSKDDLSQIEPFCPSEGIVIDAIRAAQLIMEYSVLLGNGQLFPPRFLFHGVSPSFTCILSMPANCPVRDDITCTGKRKKLAKYECCLEMVKLLYRQGEFDAHCRPNRNRTLIQIPVSIENQIFRLVYRLFGDDADSSVDIFRKKIARCPAKSDQSADQWCLYRIDEHLGFVAPCQSIKLPTFNLYGHNETFVIEVIRLKTIDWQHYRKDLEEFCRYLFEYAFSEMNTDSLLHFDLEQSTSKLLPCFVTPSGEIDTKRMASICGRRDRSVRDSSELSTDELYYTSHLTNRFLFVHLSDHSLRKRASDQRDFKVDGVRGETYADYFQSKYPGVRVRRDAFLATMKGFRKARLNYLHDTTRNTDTAEEAKTVVSDPVYFPIELLRYAPMNRFDWQWIHRLPSLLHRISQLYYVERLRKELAENIQCYSFLEANQMPTVTFSDYLKRTWTSSMLPLIALTYQNVLIFSFNSQPSPEILFQSMTRRSAAESMDMENLEILGDCFLKLAVSMCLYHRYPLAGAGALTVEKAKQISNCNLYRLALQKKLKDYLNVMKADYRGSDANWCPPGYVTNQDQAFKSSDELGLRRYTHQKVKRKAFADLIEALIGAFLISTNYSTTLQYMKWLGLDVIPTDEQNQILDTPSILCASVRSEELVLALESFYQEQSFFEIEQIIGYRFRAKAYLIAAFTHPSSFANRLTNCYERLEFLGDAVLDFLVTRHIFDTNKKITPGRVTDIRQDLSNNGRLAYILVAYRLHTKILHNSPDLFGKISVYVGDDDLFSIDSSTEKQLSKDIDQWADSRAPKALADVFEALVGAIFLDCGKCLKTVWNIIEPLLRQYIDRSMSDPNFNPVRSFFEGGGRIVQEFSKSDTKKETTVSVCIVQTADGQQMEGRGDNKKMAKYDACRRVINLLKSRTMDTRANP